MSSTYEETLRELDRLDAKFGKSVRKDADSEREDRSSPPKAPEASASMDETKPLPEAPAASENSDMRASLDRSLNFSLPGSDASPTRLHIHNNGDVDIFTKAQVDVNRYASPEPPPAPVRQSAEPPSFLALQELRDINRSMRGMRGSGAAARSTPQRPSFSARREGRLFGSATSLKYSTSGADLPADSSGSRAVLSALRALQDKIKRLEGERSKALDEVNALKQQLDEAEASARRSRELEKLTSTEQVNASRLAHERLSAEKKVIELRLSKSEEHKAGLKKEIEALRKAASEAEIARRTADASLNVAQGHTKALHDDLTDMRAQLLAAGQELAKERDERDQREIDLGVVIQKLEEQLREEKTMRCEAVMEKERLDEFLKGVVAINGELVRNIGKGTTPVATGLSKIRTGRKVKRRKEPLDTGLGRNWRALRKNKTGTIPIGSMPFLPPGQRASFNILAALSEAISQAYRANPQEALSVLYRRLNLDQDEIQDKSANEGAPRPARSQSIRSAGGAVKVKSTRRVITLPRPRTASLETGRSRMRRRRRSDSAETGKATSEQRSSEEPVPETSEPQATTPETARQILGLSSGYTIESGGSAAEHLAPPKQEDPTGVFSMRSSVRSSASWHQNSAPGPLDGSSEDLLGVEKMLQDEYDALDRQYHGLLERMKGSDDVAGKSVDSKCAEELSDVIRMLQRKARELHLLRKSLGASRKSSPARRPVAVDFVNERTSPIQSPSALDRIQSAREALKKTINWVDLDPMYTPAYPLLESLLDVPFNLEAKAGFADERVQNLPFENAESMLISTQKLAALCIISLFSCCQSESNGISDESKNAMTPRALSALQSGTRNDADRHEDTS